jgi:hypothetical protein
MTISWGSPEFYWTAPRRDVVSAALSDAARLQVSVVTAAGDQLAVESDDVAAIERPPGAIARPPARARTEADRASLRNMVFSFCLSAMICAALKHLRSILVPREKNTARL